MIDLTNLEDDCTAADVEALCATALEHRVAGVCVWPDFVELAARILANPAEAPVEVVTVVNFPTGDERPLAVGAVTERCLENGADEIDVVLPYRRFLAGDLAWCGAVLNAVRSVTAGTAAMKVILETGQLASSERILNAAEFAIGAGADFLKTSTGKSAVSATPEAFAVMAEAVAASGRDVGLKPSGGIRTGADARRYVEIAEQTLGNGWTNRTRFRFGASGLLTSLLGERAPG